jgi:Peptidase family S41
VSLLCTTHLFSQYCQVCDSSFKILSKKIELNYPGFIDKITSKASYLNFKNQLQVKARNASGVYECFVILRQFLDSFKDPHISISLNFKDLSNDSIRKIVASAPRLPLNIDSLLHYYATGKTDPVEGIWEFRNSPTKYKVAIFRNKHTSSFLGIILSADSLYWLPCQIKFIIKKTKGEYLVTMYKRDHSAARIRLPGVKASMDMGALGVWVKITSGEVTNLPEKKEIKFSVLSAKTALLVLPDFAPGRKAEIDSVILSNADKISSVSNLIIDIRSNTGGSAACYNYVLPYIYTNAIDTYPGYVMSSEDNINYYKTLLSNSANNSDANREIARLIQLMEANKGSLMATDVQKKYILDTVYAKPSNIAILCDERTSSAAELFILQARQSNKVLVYGRRTFGAIDYGNAVEKNDLPCSLLKYSLPLLKRSASGAFQYDNIGIRPDRLLNDNISNWVGHVRQIMEKQ